MFKRAITNKWIFSLWLSTLFVPTAFAQTITGNVFRDFNANGTKDNSATFNEVGVGGVTVSCTDSAGGTGTTTTSTTSATLGNYSLSGCTGATRVEFTWGLLEDYTGPNGTGNNTSVQFINATRTGVNLGLNYPGHYISESNPYYMVAQFGANRPPSTEPLATAMLKQQYNVRGQTWTTNTTSIANISQIGATWGLGYDRKNRLLYASAFVKRHAAMKDNNSDGKEDLGAIYAMNDTGSPVLWLDIASLGVDFGASLLPSISARALPTTILGPSHDGSMYPVVGKIGIGDIDVSDDYTKLYVMNLYDKKVYTIDIASKTLMGSGISVPSPCTSAAVGNGRPFALGVHRGQVFAGAVCDASISQTAADLKASVYRLDSGTFTQVLNIPLNYIKGYAFKDLDDVNSSGVQEEWGKAWNPWLDTLPTPAFFAPTTSPPSNVMIHPQPIFADIEFDVDESLILVFNDRLGHQGGQVNYGTNNTNTTDFYTALVAGDILRASYAGGSYTLESNGSVGGVTTVGAGTNEGPGGGEFYHDDNDNAAARYHGEDVIGGAALMAGKGEVMVLVTDPIGYFTGGVYFMDNTTGNVTQNTDQYQLYPETYDNTKYGKANGIGDIEIVSAPAPLEIGNRVWLDTDNDGIQDPGEAGISGVQVDLVKSGSTIASATTDANGTYYFSNAVGTDTPSAKYGLTQLVPNMAYTVRFPITATVAATIYNLTTANAGTNNLIDSDAAASGDITVLATEIPVAGANNHTFDVGYSAAPACTITAAALQNVSCYPNGTLSNGTDDQIYFSLNPTGTGLGANYIVTVSGGGTVTPATAVNYGSERWFLLNAGSAGSGNKTLTITDGTTGSCTLNVPLTDPGSCVSTCAGNLLVNPSFEIDALNATPPTGWSGTGVVGGNNMNEPEGTKYGYDNDGPAGNLYQDISATAGDTFTMKFYAGSHAPGSQTVSIRYLDSSGATLGTASTYNIAFDTDVFTPQILGGPYMLTLASAPAGTAAVRVEANNGGLDFAKVDAFCLEKTSLPVCAINTPIITPTCNDNGTSSNPADDTFTFTISTTGSNTGASYKVDKTAPAPTSTVFASVNYGATSAASSSFPISGGNLTLTLTDNTTTTCSLTPVTVTAPPTCSSVVPGQPDLKLLKTASATSVSSGQTLTYTITLNNEGTSSATGVQVRDILPAGVTFASATPSQGTYNNGTGLWNVGTVAVGASLTLTITVTVN